MTTSRTALALVGLGLVAASSPSFAQCEQAKLTATDVSQLFGWDVSISGDVAVIGALGPPPPPSLPYAAPGASPVDAAGRGEEIGGAAYVFRREGGSWIEEAKLNASDQGWEDMFAASVSITGDFVMVGAPDKVEPCPDGFCGSGAVYVFRRDGNAWIEQVKLTPGDATLGYAFGRALGVSGDLAIIGDPSDFAPCPDGEYVCGSAYVFRREGTTWVEEAKLAASDAGDGDYFGASVAITGDLAVVGALRENLDTGAAYVFRREGTTWAEEAKLTPSDLHEGDEFGASVDIDQGIIVVGAWLYDGTGISTGSAYVFRRQPTNWIQEAKLEASDGAAYDFFGVSVSISADTIVVGASGDDDACPAEPDCKSGAAYLFRRFGPTWLEVAKLTGADAAFRDGLATVAIDGNDVLVGAYRADGQASDTGAAYVFAVSQCVTPIIPVVSLWGLVVMVALILTAGGVVIARRARLEYRA